MEFNYRFKKAVIDKELPLSKVLERLEVIKPGAYVPGCTCFCCFHENTETPAAKLYDDDAGETLFCFSEQRSYRSSDAFREFSNYKLDSIFNSVWKGLSSEAKEFYMNNYAISDESSIEEWKPTLEELDKFKLGKINYNDFINVILKKVKEDTNG